jgi:hypothetical protein
VAHAVTESPADHWKALLQSLALHAAVLGVFVLAVAWGLSRPAALPARAGEAGAPEAMLGRIEPPGAAAAATSESSEVPDAVEIDLAGLTAPTADEGLRIPDVDASPPPVPLRADTDAPVASPRETSEAAAAERSTAGSPTASDATGASDDLYSRYLGAIRRQALAAWAPVGPEPLRCQVLLTQLPGGHLVDVAFLDCPHPPAVREALLRAFAKDRPWPYAGFEPVFRSQVSLTLCHPATADCPP